MRRRLPEPLPALDGAAAVPKARTKVVQLNVFYGFPARLVATWCRCSESTARLYKTGLRKPSRAALTLFMLHRDQRVLGPAWRGFRVQEDRLLDPAGDALRVGQIATYRLLLQWAAELAKKDPQTQERYQE